MDNFEFDWRNPDYTPIYIERARRLQFIRANPDKLPALRAYYAENPGQFIDDWGMTYDPRNAAVKRPTTMPFLLFPRQRELCDEFVDAWRSQEDLLVEKSRDMGLSWLAVALGATLCLFHDGVQIGYGSRKEILVDRIGDPDSLFFKARWFVNLLPAEFRPGWEAEKHAPHMRIVFPHTGSTMRGEAGNNIGRGGRASAYFTDEDAFMPNGQLVDAALSQNTNCRISVSSVNGMQNSFAQRRHSGRVRVFTFGWRSDPRKDEAWYEKQCDRLDPVIVAQEIDLSYTASVSGVVIPYEWIEKAVDADIILGLERGGDLLGALDVADEGLDKNAFAGREGIRLEYVDEWSGVGSDIMETTRKAHTICVDEGYDLFYYDADGLGAGVRGDIKTINAEPGAVQIEARQFRGSGAVVHPDAAIPTANVEDDEDGYESQRVVRTNKDYFKNQKAQGWWNLRMRFLITYRAVTTGVVPRDPSMLISLSSTLPLLARLKNELTQPTYKKDPTGKILIDKSPDGAKSPNLGDSVMILYAPRNDQEPVGILLPRR